MSRAVRSDPLRHCLSPSRASSEGWTWTEDMLWDMGGGNGALDHHGSGGSSNIGVALLEVMDGRPVEAGGGYRLHGLQECRPRCWPPLTCLGLCRAPSKWATASPRSPPQWSEQPSERPLICLCPLPRELPDSNTPYRPTCTGGSAFNMTFTFCHLSSSPLIPLDR